MGCLAATKIFVALSMPICVVGGRMHDQQRLVQPGDLGDQIVLGDIVEEFALDAEWPAGELDLDLAFSRIASTCSANMSVT